MKKPCVGVAKEGFCIIFLLAFTAFIFAIVSCEIMALLFLILFWFSVFFFRDPERVIPHAKDLVVSPADGKIIRISTAPHPFSGEDCKCISIFMNVFSVHVNRSPVAGKITDIKYIPGKFFNASLNKASTDNERCAYSLIDEDGNNFAFVQISGLIARRIVTHTEIGDELARGERFGLIKFGSRVDLYLPDNCIPTVHIGEKVFAGQSVIADKI